MIFLPLLLLLGTRPAAAADPLAAGSCVASSDGVHHYSIAQSSIYWTAVAVNPPPGEDKDIAIYSGPDQTGDLLASSSGIEGTDFVIGDFNHNPPGTYYPTVYFPSAGAWVAEWDDDANRVTFNAPASGTVGGGSGDCGLIRVWDVYLEADLSYEFRLEAAGADIRVALFRNPGSGVYWNNRLASEFEKTAGDTPVTYTAPADDWYGVVVFNNSAGSPNGSYTLYVSESVTRCVTRGYVPYAYNFTQAAPYWTGFAVNPTGGDDKDVAVRTGPMGTGTLLAESDGTDGTDFVVGDFNHNPWGTYYPVAHFGSPLAPHVAQWAPGVRVLWSGPPVGASVGGASGDCGLIRMWDVYLEAGKGYTFTLLQGGAADIRLALFRNPAAAEYWAPRSAAEFEKGAAETPFVYSAPAGDWYGVAVFNHSPGSPAGDYALSFAEGLASAECVARDDIPHGFFFNQPDIYWTAVAVNPAPGDDKDIEVRTLPNGQGDLLASSIGLTGTDFVVGDFNHDPLGTYYPWVSYGDPLDHAVEWDGGPDQILLGIPVSGTVGGGSGDCGVVRVWDASLDAGKDYRFTLSTGGAADIRVAVFKNPASAEYWAPRTAAEFEKAAGETPFVYSATADDWYGIVVFNNSPGSQPGTYTLEMDLASPVELTSFEAAASPGRVDLRWTTGREEDVLGFHVLRSATPAGRDAVEVTTSRIDAGRRAYAFTDEGVAPGRYWYWIEETTRSGARLRYGPRSAEVPAATAAPAAGFFARGEPNPFAGSTSIVFGLPEAGPARLGIYSVHGRLVRSLVAGEALGAGEHRLTWDGRDDGGRPVASGVYTCRLEAGGRGLEQKLEVLR